MKFSDRIKLDKIRRTKDGYLVCTPRVSRVGIQQYHSSELGLDDDRVVNVFRSEDEVFSKESLGSLAHRPITLFHPPEAVDASNWKDYSVGTTGDEILRDGEFVRVPMCLMDKNAIDACVNDGTIELSMGYSADLEFIDGEFDGVKYEAVQKNIRGNHLAIVDKARGGDKLNLVDNLSILQDGINDMKKMLLDGITIEVSETSEEIIRKFVKDQEEEMKKEIEKKDEEIAKVSEEKEKTDEEKTGLEAKIAELITAMEALKEMLSVKEKEASPEAIDEKVKEKMEAVDTASKIFPDAQWKGKSAKDIRREVVNKKLGDKAKNWSDDQIFASFNTFNLTDSSLVVDSFASNSSFGGKISDSEQSYQEMVNNLQNAWRKK